MNGKRESLVMRLVERKMAAGSPSKVFCVCFAASPKNQAAGVLAASRSKPSTS